MSVPETQAAAPTESASLLQQIRVIRRYAPYYRRHWPKLILVFLLTPIVGAVISSLIAVLSIILLDEVLPRGKYFWVALFVTGGFLGAVLRDSNFLIEGFIRFNLKMEILRDLGRDFYNHMLDMSMAFHTKHSVGERIFRTFTDTHDTARMLGVSLPTAAAMVLQGLLMISITLFIDWRPAVAIALFFPPYVLITQYFTKLWRRSDRSMREARSRVTAHLQETYTHVAVVKVSAREEDEAQRYQSFLSPFLRSLYAWFVFEGIQEGLICPAGLATIFSASMGYVLGYLHIAGQITLGQWIALVGLIQMGLVPISTVILNYQTLCREMVAAERVLDILNVRSRIPEKAKPVRPSRLLGRIECEGVNFQYNGETVLKNVSFTIEPGEHVAFIGHSGCGKSTLLGLLLRFRDPGSGAIRVDGVDLRDMDADYYRRRLGVVMQNPQVFPGTLHENIVYGASGSVSAEKLRAALEASDCAEFIDELPDGLDTPMDEGGNLSGGQKQRLTIARALARESDVLMLDEPLASVDIDSQLRVYQAIRRDFLGKTVLFITHTPSAVRFADRIYVLNHGEIADVGTYEELKSRGAI